METKKETFTVERIISEENKYVIVGMNGSRIDLPKEDCILSVPPKPYWFKKHQVEAEYLPYTPIIIKLQMDNVVLFEERAGNIHLTENQEIRDALAQYDDNPDVLRYNIPNLQSFFKEREDIYLTSMGHIDRLPARLKIEGDIICAAGALLREFGAFRRPDYQEALHFLVAYADLPMKGDLFVRRCILQMIDFAEAFAEDKEKGADYTNSKVLRLPSFILPEVLGEEVITRFFKR